MSGRASRHWHALLLACSAIAILAVTIIHVPASPSLVSGSERVHAAMAALSGVLPGGKDESRVPAHD